MVSTSTPSFSDPFTPMKFPSFHDPSGFCRLAIRGSKNSSAATIPSDFGTVSRASVVLTIVDRNPPVNSPLFLLVVQNSNDHAVSASRRFCST